MSAIVRSLAVLACALVLFGCGSSSHPAASTSGAQPPTAAVPAARQYPTANQNAFVSACERSASAGLSRGQAQRYCQQALACVEQRLSFAQFRLAEQRAVSGQANPGIRTISACATVAARATGVQIRTTG